jgi:hypothetical protein
MHGPIQDKENRVEINFVFIIIQIVTLFFDLLYQFMANKTYLSFFLLR